MEPCNRCGAVDRHRMIALMSRWFAAHAGLQLEGGYFYLCPACYQEKIEGEFEAITERIRAYQKPDRASREGAMEADAAAQAAAAAGHGAGAGAPAQSAPASADQAPPPQLEAASAPSERGESEPGPQPEDALAVPAGLAPADVPSSDDAPPPPPPPPTTTSRPRRARRPRSR